MKKSFLILGVFAIFLFVLVFNSNETVVFNTVTQSIHEESLVLNDTLNVSEVVENFTIKPKIKKLKDIVSDDVKLKVKSKLLDNNVTDEKVRVLIKQKEQDDVDNSTSKKDKDKKSKKNKKQKKSKLTYAELNASEISELILQDDVLEVWEDLETQSFLTDAVNQINVESTWNLGLSGSGIKVAILDTGIDTDHEMFSDRIILSYDFTTSGNVEDGYGHGTHVAGIVGGDANYTGVAPEVSILNGKVLDDNGAGRLSWLIDGIDWAIDNNADVISLSLGAIYSGSAEDQLNSPEVLKVQEAIDAGIVVVIASGNCGNGCNGFTGVTTPAIAEDAITVGAVDSNNNVASFSSGSYVSDYIKPDLVAPGVNICSSVPNGYDCMSGTSMATPFVSGASALLLEWDSNLTPSQIKSIFESGALDLGALGKDTSYGSGLIDLSNIAFDLGLSVIEDVDVSYGFDNISLSVDVNGVDSVIMNISNNGHEYYGYYDDDFNFTFIPEIGNCSITIKAVRGDEVEIYSDVFGVYNYDLKVPDLIVGSNEIVLDYYNIDDDNKDVTVSFYSKEFETEVLLNETQKVKKNDFTSFVFEYNPTVPGEHKISVVLDEESKITKIDRDVSVSASFMAETISGLSLRVD